MSSFDELYVPIGFVIRAHRKQARQTLTDTAIRAGISKGFLSKIESGNVKNPTLKTLIGLAYALSVPLSEIVENWERKKI